MYFTNFLFPLLLALPGLTKASRGHVRAVNTTSGVVHGFEPVPGVHAYLGIPYATPPLGALRFLPPQPVQHSEKPIDATAYGPSCMQFTYRTLFSAFVEPPEPQSEDCLTVNIWAPAGRKLACEKEEDGLPVMVWIYGGGFSEGTSAWEFTDGSNIVRAHPDVIVASFNYRLNIFGFPNSPALPQRNVGLLDSRFAVEWLHANIFSFGGDPSKITLFGESAGAVTIGSYAYAYVDDPLARAFIMQSGTVDALGNSDDSEFKRVSNAVGCGGRSDSERLRCFRAVDAVRIQHAISNSTQNSLVANNGGMPGVDNLTVWTLAETYRRKFARLPTLLGVNHREGDNFVPYSATTGINTTLSDIVTLSIFTCPSARHALLRTNASVPVWRYRYMAHLPSVTPYAWIRGAYHGAEITPLFAALDYGVAAPQQWERDISDYLTAAWVAFVKDPHHGLTDTLGWPRYNPTGNTLVEMFPDNKVGVEFVPAGKYDAGCDNPPRVPWESFLP